jgi:uncharacterized protein YjbI with pentapeptide repeats
MIVSKTSHKKRFAFNKEGLRFSYHNHLEKDSTMTTITNRFTGETVWTDMGIAETHIHCAETLQMMQQRNISMHNINISTEEMQSDHPPFYYMDLTGSLCHDILINHRIFIGCNFTGCDFSHSDFSNAIFKDCIFSNADLKEVHLNDTNFINCIKHLDGKRAPFTLEMAKNNET